MTKPIRPDEIVLKESKGVAPAVILTINDLLSTKFNGQCATISTEEIKSELIKNYPFGLLAEQSEQNDWLNPKIIYKLYRQAGWSVVHEKPPGSEYVVFEFSMR